MKRIPLLITLMLVMTLFSGCYAQAVNDIKTELQTQYDENKEELKEELTGVVVDVTIDAVKKAIEAGKENVAELNAETAATLGINLADYDKNNDGKLSVWEIPKLASDMKDSNKEKGSPIGAAQALVFLLSAFGLYKGGKYAAPRILNSQRHNHDKVLKSAGNGGGAV